MFFLRCLVISSSSRASVMFAVEVVSFKQTIRSVTEMVNRFALFSIVVVGASSVPCPFLNKKSAVSKQAPLKRRLQEELGYDVAEVKSRISEILPNTAADSGNYQGF